VRTYMQLHRQSRARGGLKSSNAAEDRVVVNLTEITDRRRNISGKFIFAASSDKITIHKDFIEDNQLRQFSDREILQIRLQPMKVGQISWETTLE
jgi:hypothetical protein